MAAAAQLPATPRRTAISHKIGDYVIENRAGPKAMVNKDGVRVMSTRYTPARRGHVVGLNGRSMEIRLLDGTTIADGKTFWSKMLGSTQNPSPLPPSPSLWGGVGVGKVGVGTPAPEPAVENFPPAGNLPAPKPVAVADLRQSLRAALNVDVTVVRKRSGQHAGRYVISTIKRYSGQTMVGAEVLAERLAHRIGGIRVVAKHDQVATWRDTQDTLSAMLILEQIAPVESLPTALAARPCMAIVPVCPPPCRAIALFHGGAPA